MIPLLITLLFSLNVNADTIKVAVIDTGFDFHSEWKGEKFEKSGLYRPKLCSEGHFDFNENSMEFGDNHGHGTHIAGVIAKGNEQNDYCLVILSYYNPKIYGNNLFNTILAFQRAIDLKVDIINYSGGGLERSQAECDTLKLALDKGIAVFAAAGNERSDLNKDKYWPAMCDDRIFKVINIDDSKKHNRVPTSNYDSTGKIPNMIKYEGMNIDSLWPGNEKAPMSGTSQSCARATSDYIPILIQDRKNMKLIEKYGAYII